MLKARNKVLSALFLTTIALLLSLGCPQNEVEQPPEEPDATQSAQSTEGPAESMPPYHGEDHFRSLRQLTFGGENAEAYFSWDGSLIIFQSTRPPYECDQIFTMKTDGSDVRLVSTGAGRTTCAFIGRGNERIIYASTHMADENCPAPPEGISPHSYAWVLYDSFDIFSANIDGSGLVRLTDEPGYDAECAISPDGEKIVFSSTRSGDQELYVMDIDGGNVKQLTNELGYDGGPFFSWDGGKIVYRSSRPKTPEEIERYSGFMDKDLMDRGSDLEVYVMDADGGYPVQVTDLGGANFAPFMHPDGERIIFCSNHESRGRRFDLYIINIDGSGLERVTNNESFDGFPMFSRDGKYLIFCSNRFAENPGDTNVFIAEWVD